MFGDLFIFIIRMSLRQPNVKWSAHCFEHRENKGSNE